MRAAVIGARRTRQGTGPYLARFLAAAGVEVVAVLGSSTDRAAAAARDLAPELGRAPHAYGDPRALFAHPGLDLVVVASPYPTHERFLRGALGAGLHALAEKPLLWGGTDPARRAQELAAAFLARGLHLGVNAQWPWTLEAYRTLHPDPGGPPRRFAMHMAPRVLGREALLESLSHPLSLLAHLVPGTDARLEDVRIRGLAPRSSDCRVLFSYRRGAHAVDAEVRLVSDTGPNRRMAYALDGAWATRRVEAAGAHDFRLSLEGGGRRIPLPDPTPRLVGSFVQAIAAGPPAAPDPAAVPGMRHLATLMQAAEEILGTPRA
jgi:predicted dehydrogenase